MNDDTGYIFYIKIYEKLLDEEIIQYMNDFYYKFQKKLLGITTRLEKELLILKKDRDEINGKEFKELIDEKRLEYLNNEINLIANKIEKIENEKDEELLTYRLRSEEMLFVIYKTIKDLREYFKKNNEWENLKELYEYINLIRKNEILGLKDPVDEHYFLRGFYMKKFPKLFKERLQKIYGEKPEEFMDKEIYNITIGDYDYVNAWRPLDLPVAYETLFKD